VSDESLDELAREFKDASSALQEARRRVDGLGSAQRAISDAGDSVQSLASILDEFVAEVKEAAEALNHSQESSARLLAEAAGVLSGNDLSSIRESVAELVGRVDQVQGAIEVRQASDREALEAAIASLLAASETRFSALESSIAALAKTAAGKAVVEAELAHLKANISPRHLKKAQETFQPPASA
jgi:NTP pyrophosphatase (non-canonical NTP hydrolase)